MHSDHARYIRFCGPSIVAKNLNALLGIIQGVAIDAKINGKELGYLRDWIAGLGDMALRHPFNELVKALHGAVADSVLSKEEHDDILWLCNKIVSEHRVGDSMQRLHGILAGIASDQVIGEQELRRLSAWMDEHGELETCWPYDEINALITQVLRDKKVSSDEQEQLLNFFSEFGQIGGAKTLSQAPIGKEAKISGVCAVSPDVKFEGMRFCFTGASKKYTRRDFRDLVLGRGGYFVDYVGPGLNYLVIGGEGNPCWAYACYGRKVETAMTLRRDGHRIVLVHEYDFVDAIA
jgi:NAD-dependent DNA ligase